MRTRFGCFPTTAVSMLPVPYGMQTPPALDSKNVSRVAARISTFDPGDGKRFRSATRLLFFAGYLSAAAFLLQADHLGSRWEIQGENGWHATWTRRGSSEWFDNVYQQGQNPNVIRRVGKMSLNGQGFSQQEWRAGATGGNPECTYEGTIAQNGIDVRASGFCPASQQHAAGFTAKIFGGEPFDASCPGCTSSHIKASVECQTNPFIVQIGELPSRYCTVWIRDWRHNTSDRVEVLFPEQLDWWGNHLNGIQVFTGTVSGGRNPGPANSVDPASMEGFRCQNGSYGNCYPYGVLVLACNARIPNCKPFAVPVPFSVPIIVRQKGAGEVMVAIAGTAQGIGGGTSADPGQHGTTLQGTNLGFFGSNSAAACQAACNRPDCRGWSFVYKGAFASNPNNGVCYLMTQVTAQVPSPCCTSEVKGMAQPSRPAGLDLRGKWSGTQFCRDRNWEHVFMVDTQNVDGTASGTAADGSPFTLRVTGDQFDMIRPTWGVTWKGRLASTPTGLRMDGTTPDNCTFSLLQQR